MSGRYLSAFFRYSAFLAFFLTCGWLKFHINFFRLACFDAQDVPIKFPGWGSLNISRISLLVFAASFADIESPPDIIRF